MIMGKVMGRESKYILHVLHIFIEYDCRRVV